ncbi:MAG: hypothetical protein KJO08_02435 [Gammaproteobacteria bacterium]|nr:hypothetical protein [Gammaproteobacteria bacterium]NNJ83329.1 hypothetical protein [Gammaproteobacteria bacterium]
MPNQDKLRQIALRVWVLSRLDSPDTTRNPMPIGNTDWQYRLATPMPIHEFEGIARRSEAKPR